MVANEEALAKYKGVISNRLTLKSVHKSHIMI